MFLHVLVPYYLLHSRYEQQFVNTTDHDPSAEDLFTKLTAGIFVSLPYTILDLSVLNQLVTYRLTCLDGHMSNSNDMTLIHSDIHRQLWLFWGEGHFRRAM